jgi:hypothetical protein
MTSTMHFKVCVAYVATYNIISMVMEIASNQYIISGNISQSIKMRMG